MFLRRSNGCVAEKRSDFMNIWIVNKRINLCMCLEIL